MSESQIEAMYKAQYDARQKEYEKAKRKQLEQLALEEKQYENAFNSTKQQIDMNRTNTANRYKEMYNQLQNRYSEGKKRYYNERDTASVDNAKNTQAIRDYMAKNNLLQSGESVDALLRNNTDFSNNMGSIRDNENTFTRNINDTRSGYQRDEQAAYSQLDKSLADAMAEYNLGKSKIVQNRTSAEQDYLDNIATLTKEIEAAKAKALMDYQTSLASASYSSGRSGGSYRSGGSGGSSSGGSYDNFKSDLSNEIQYAIQSADFNNMRNARDMVQNAYAQGYISGDEYNTYVGRINSTINSVKKAQASVNKGTYSNGSGKTSYNKNKITSTRT